jgi:acyl-CoA synthetase (AMP-forming)/AMP-acid ligase II
MRWITFSAAQITSFGDSDAIIFDGRTYSYDCLLKLSTSGEKVYPSEVENILLQVANVAEATVSGRVSPVTGMLVKATIQLAHPEDERSAIRRVRQYCRQHLEPYKVPAVIEVSSAQQRSDRFKKIRKAV